VGIRDGEVDLYNVNIPMIEKLLSSDCLPVTWSTMWRNSYGRLFQQQLAVTIHQTMRIVTFPNGPRLVPTRPLKRRECNTTASQATTDLFATRIRIFARPGVLDQSSNDSLPEGN